MQTIAGVAESERGTKQTLFAVDRARASLRLDFEREERTGRTVLAASRQEPPLRVVRAFALEDGAALVHLHNVSGGVLGGDQLGLTVHVGAEACAQITTTGATRIYLPREESPTATQWNEVAIGESALLEYLPDPLIPFAGARFWQRTVIRLARGAGLFWWEILAPGREARGEIFEYTSVELKSDLVAIGRPIAAERVRLEPKNRALASLARLGPYRTWATFYICRVGLDPSAWLEAERDLREIVSRLSRPGEALWGISTLTAHGLVVRCIASRGRDVLPGLHALWRAAKLRLYGREAVPPRKVN
jgi:urease accessory protein